MSYRTTQNYIEQWKRNRDWDSGSNDPNDYLRDTMLRMGDLMMVIAQELVGIREAAEAAREEKNLPF